MAFHVTMDWTHADGSNGFTTLIDNVEAYAPGNPIFALAGDDNLTGSSTNDIMVFGQPISHDIVKNFDVAHDQVDLLGFAGTTNFAEVSAHLAADGDGNAVLNFGDGMSITFTGVHIGDLSAANFVFNQEPVTTNTGSMALSDGSIMPLHPGILRQRRSRLAGQCFELRPVVGKRGQYHRRRRCYGQRIRTD
jgi:hypothetical protein